MLRAKANILWIPSRGLFFPWGHTTEESLQKKQALSERQIIRSAPALPSALPSATQQDSASSVKDQILLQKGESTASLSLRSGGPNALLLSKDEAYASLKRKFLPSRIDDELIVFSDPSEGEFMKRTGSQWIRKFWKYPFPSITNYDYYVQEERKKAHTTLVSVQLLDEERLISLGTDLSAAWFLLSRNCRVRFKDHSQWLDSSEIKKEEDLPSTFKPGYYLECIDASRSLLIYEGLQNLRNLPFLKHLDVSYSEMVDEWFIDRVAGEYRETLEYLDISGCYRLDWNGIEAIARFRNLKVLILRDLDHIENLKLICLLLLEVNPDLDIRGVDYIDIELLQEGGHEELLEELDKDLLFIQEGADAKKNTN